MGAGVVGRPLRAVLEAHAHSNYSHGQSMKHGTIADELVGAHRREGRNRIEERNEARFGQASSEPDHVLLGDPDIDEALWEAIGKRLECHETEVAGQ